MTQCEQIRPHWVFRSEVNSETDSEDVTLTSGEFSSAINTSASHECANAYHRGGDSPLLWSRTWKTPSRAMRRLNGHPRRRHLQPRTALRPTTTTRETPTCCNTSFASPGTAFAGISADDAAVAITSLLSTGPLLPQPSYEGCKGISYIITRV